MSDTLFKPVAYRVEGMTCTNCALGIQRALEKEGFQNVDVDFSSGEVHFEVADEGRLPVAEKRIESLGYKVKDSIETEDEGKKGLSAIEKKFWFTAIFTIPLILAMFIPLDFLHNDKFQLALTIPVFIVGFLHFGRSAWYSLRSGVTNMDVLIFLGSTAAFVYSLIGTIYGLGSDYLFYETSASIISIVLLGNMMEHRSVKKTSSAVDDLVRLQKNTARLITTEMNEGQETIEEVDASLVEEGQRVLVNTGDKVPVDGEIYWGSGSLDESLISGESLPVDRQKGDKVVGGTLLVSGTIRVKATATGKDTVLANIIEMVREAQKDKPRLQNLADKISRVFVPVVVGLALLTAAFWFFGMELPFRDAFMRGVAVLVIACPCALGLAIPTAVVVGLGRTAKSGILIKGGTVFDKFASVDTIVFDKTGTLTTGNFGVKNLQVFNDTEDHAGSVIYSLEQYSAHPIAQSITRYFKGVTPIQFEEVKEQKGLGVQAVDKDGNQYAAGSYHIASHLTSDDRHNVYLLMNDRLIAWLDVEDEIKEGAKESIDFFNSRGVKTVLLSGDRPERCEAIAAQLGIKDVYAGKLPAQKLEIIDQLSENGRVAMVGDGINDAPALAKAYVGISMSDATQVAVKSADVVLLKGDLRLLSKAFGATRITLRTVKENLFWAFFYNVAAIPLAMIGLLTPIVAAFAMAASDVVVVLNSLRLKTRKIR
ncbi:MAG: cation-translocating P-type ATPase [Bacteroidales bacterium]